MREPFRDFPFADRGSAMYFLAGALKKKARSPRAAGQRERERSRVLPISSLDAFFR